MGPKHAGEHRGGGDHEGGEHGGRGGGHGGQGGQGGQGGGPNQGGAPNVDNVGERLRLIKQNLESLKDHGHINQNDIEKIMNILPNA